MPTTSELLLLVLTGLVAFKCFAHFIWQKYAPWVDMTGKVVIITGASDGIGKATAGALAHRGAHVIMACRSEQRTKEAIADLKAQYKKELQLSFMPLDLTSLKSVCDFVDAFKARQLPLHVLYNNAGIALMPYGVTKAGVEQHWAVNYVGHFVLSLLLLDVLKKSPSSRIINTGSHRLLGAKPFASVLKGYSRNAAYGSSKLAIAMFAHYLAKQLKGTDVAVFTVDPGVVATNVTRFLGSRVLQSVAWVGMMLWQTPLQGAQTSIHTACSQSVMKNSGKYFKNCQPHRLPDYCTDDSACEELFHRTLSDIAQYDKETAAKLAAAGFS